jgi:oligoendopeptidase F
MTAEDLAERHLGFDIQSQSFWDNVIDSIHPRIDEYERLLNSVL